MNLLREGVLEVAFARRKETRVSSRYSWNGEKRGGDPFVILQYTMEGEGRFEIGGTTHRVPAGHAFIALVPEKSRYFYPADRQAKRGPWTFAWLNLAGELNLRLWPDLREQAGPVIKLSRAAARTFLRLARAGEDLKAGDWFATSRDVYQLYLEVLRDLPPQRPGGPVREMAEYFRSHYPKTIRMKEAADRVGMSREHFSRLFAEEMNEGPASYLRRLRLEAAARLLRTTDLPRGEVAFRTGWPSTRKLEQFFRRAYGTSLESFRAAKARASKASAYRSGRGDSR